MFAVRAALTVSVALAHSPQLQVRGELKEQQSCLLCAADQVSLQSNTGSGVSMLPALWRFGLQPRAARWSSYVWESYFAQRRLLRVLLHLLQQGSHNQLCVHTCLRQKKQGNCGLKKLWHPSSGECKRPILQFIIIPTVFFILTIVRMSSPRGDDQAGNTDLQKQQPCLCGPEL